MSLAPPVPYFGGKQRIADRVVDLFPPHQHYVEPFAGGLSVLLAKPPSALETVNDLDGDVMTFWRVLRDQPGELARVCSLTPHSRAEHQASYDRTGGLTDLERARRIWVQLTQGRTGTLRKTGWRFHADANGTTMGMPAYLSGYLARMAPVAARLANVSLECRPGLDVIATYSHPGTLLYVDPPYLRETRSGMGYRHEMPDEAEHRDLAEALNATSAAVVLSGYHSPLYDELYAGGTSMRSRRPPARAPSGKSGWKSCGATVSVKTSSAETTDPLFNPGRRLYEQARRLRRAKRVMQLRGVTAVPTKPATVLQFPDKKEVLE